MGRRSDETVLILSALFVYIFQLCLFIRDREVGGLRDSMTRRLKEGVEGGV